MTEATAASLAHFRELWNPQGPELETLERMEQFLFSHPDVFQRHHAVGHFTGSAVVVDERLERVALHLHRKLNQWMQFGGHADGEVELDQVALKEAREESSLEGLEFLPYERWLRPSWTGPAVPFDVDIHEIPPWRDVPAHFHFDVNYLLVCRQPDSLRLSPESRAVGWFALEEARQLCPEAKLQREFDRIERLRALRTVSLSSSA